MLLMEWKLNSRLQTPLFLHWATPDMDLLSTFSDRKLARFMSPYPDHQALGIDTMSIPWTELGQLICISFIQDDPLSSDQVLSVSRSVDDSQSSTSDVRVIDAGTTGDVLESPWWSYWPSKLNATFIAHGSYDDTVYETVIYHIWISLE